MTQSDAGVASLTPTKITPAELDAFSAAQVQGSFQQTSQMAAMGAFNGPVDYVGVKRGDKLIAACYVVYTRSRFGLEGSVWCGPLCDYDNPQVAHLIVTGLRNGFFMTNQSVAFVRVKQIISAVVCPHKSANRQFLISLRQL